MKVCFLITDGFPLASWSTQEFPANRQDKCFRHAGREPMVSRSQPRPPAVRCPLWPNEFCAPACTSQYKDRERWDFRQPMWTGIKTSLDGWMGQ